MTINFDCATKENKRTQLKLAPNFRLYIQNINNWKF